MKILTSHYSGYFYFLARNQLNELKWQRSGYEGGKITIPIFIYKQWLWGINMKTKVVPRINISIWCKWHVDSMTNYLALPRITFMETWHAWHLWHMCTHLTDVDIQTFRYLNSWFPAFVWPSGIGRKFIWLIKHMQSNSNMNFRNFKWTTL